MKLFVHIAQDDIEIMQRTKIGKADAQASAFCFVCNEAHLMVHEERKICALLHGGKVAALY